MPEVVEVGLTALFLNKKLKDKLLNDIKVMGGRYAKTKMTGIDLFSKHKPLKITKVDSKGKFLWFELTDKDQNDFYILNRFGMEGEWGFTKKKHSDILFVIKNKDTKKIQNLYFTDYRHFGSIEITNNVNDLNKILNKLGPDFLKENFTDKDFHKRIGDFIGSSIKRRNIPIIKILMDQNALGSGLGNYLAPTILYKAMISPYKKLGDIYNNKKLSNYLAEAIKYVTKLVYMTGEVGYLEDLDPSVAKFVNKLRADIKKNKNHNKNFHLDVILKKDDKFTFEIYGKDKDPFGNTIKADKIIKGRTTYWSPAIQNR